MKLLTLHEECTYAFCQSIYLSIHLSIYISLDMYASISLSIIQSISPQGFPQVLRTWGALQNLMGGALSQSMGGASGGLKSCRKIPVKEFI